MAHILIADDDSSFRSYIQTVLEDAGHTVGFASDGDQAVEFYRRGTFDLAIIDLIMPGKNGVRAIREIHESDPAAKLVAVSGQDADQLRLAEDSGAQKALAKPIESEELMEVISQLLRRSTGWQGVIP